MVAVEVEKILQQNLVIVVVQVVEDKVILVIFLEEQEILPQLVHRKEIMVEMV